jgi:hypothetical protein
MTHTARITQTSATRPATSQITNRDTETITTATNTDKTKTQTEEAHHCITIRGAVPASGRPGTTTRLVDLDCVGLAAGTGWFSC